MPIAPKDVAVDGCYRTLDDEVRHVMNISGDQVSFEARDSTYRRYPWEQRPAQTRARFASEVVEPVSSHWNTTFRPLKERTEKGGTR